MKALIYIAGFLFLTSCQSEPKEDLSLLQGYWEIQSVQTPDGQDKEFGINTIVDYFELNGMEGSRSKMQPQLDGSYVKQPTTERFRVKDSAGNWYLFYSTPYDSWVERLKKLDEQELVLQIPMGNTYRYKKYEPLDLSN